jgi:nucleotide-binding universal stress UspA family protein
MYSKILVPVDGTPFPEIAIPHAGKLSAHFGARCHILWVESEAGALNLNYSIPFHPPYIVADTLDDKTIARKLETILKWAPAADYSYSIDRGDLVEKAVEYASGHGFDLIVMANRQHKGLAKYLAGRDAQRIVEQAGCPVLLVTTELDVAEEEATLHRKICEQLTKHSDLLASAVYCGEKTAMQAVPEAVGILLKGLADSSEDKILLDGLLTQIQKHRREHEDVAEFLKSCSNAPLGLVSQVLQESATQAADLLARDIPDLTQPQAMSIMAVVLPVVLTELAAQADNSSALRGLLRSEMSKDHRRSEERGHQVAEKVLN